MRGEILPAGAGSSRVVATVEGFADLPIPAVIAREGEQAAKRFIEFFTANIRNPNTRAAYARAVWQFGGTGTAPSPHSSALGGKRKALSPVFEP
ncbi:MAG: hypothetical protein P4L46_21720 [Fimbriimonas sp.]|nr:hypothetical protein [Fimbriimonas sp.]